MQSDQLENKICSYLECGAGVRDILKADSDLNIVPYLADWIIGMAAWFPYDNAKNILQVGSWYGAFSGYLSEKTKQLIVLEKDERRYKTTKKRCKDINNMIVLNQNPEEFASCSNEKFDYIYWAVDELFDRIEDYEKYQKCFSVLKSLVKEGGQVIAALPNKFGFRYLCGEPDESTGIAYGGITDRETALYRMDLEEVHRVMDAVGFGYHKVFYPITDMRFTQVLYSDEYKPSETVRERIHIFLKHKENLMLDEALLVDALARNDNLCFFSNSFFVVAGEAEQTDMIFSAVTAERKKENAYVTSIHRCGKVRKSPIYDKGENSVDRLIKNTECLKERGICVVPIKKQGISAEMEYVKTPTLSEYIKKQDHFKREELEAMVDALWKQILVSSEEVDASLNKLSTARAGIDYGVILKNVYSEMIPVNCFYDGKQMLFFDQEHVKEDYPAGYVLFRALRDIYTYIPKCEKILPIEELKQKYNLVHVWDDYQKEEDAFQNKLRNLDLYTGFMKWVFPNKQIMKENREQLSRQRIVKDTVDRRMENMTDIFDVKSGLDAKYLLVFGTGKYADYYLERYGNEKTPTLFLDNLVANQNTKKAGIDVKAPSAILEYERKDICVVIAVKNYDAILEQLYKMGLEDENIRIVNKRLDDLYPGKLGKAQTDGLYDVGFVTGAFDLFHIGHLNILKNSKSRCHYLIAGVLVDEIIEQDKHKKPFIPFEERIEIVKQCKYVDRVVAIDQHNTNKIDAWKELRYGCLFAGSDHLGAPYWMNLQKELRHLGSELEFFPYTQGTSSTMLQKVLNDSLKG